MNAITRYPPQPCLNCEYVMDAATAIEEEAARPKGGDVALCFRCGYAQIYNDDMTFRHPNAHERAQIKNDAMIRRAQRAIYQLRQER